jgi:23S rRNA (uracil1939-C5)-methyltransferase
MVYTEDDHSGLLRHLVIKTSFSRNESMVILVINGDSLPFHNEWISSLSVHSHISSLYLCHNQTPGDEVLNGPLHHLWGAPHLEETILDRTYRIGPSAFFQSNPQQTAKLVSLIRNALTSSPQNSRSLHPTVLWDLYCGGGLFGIALSAQFDHVIGVDSSSENIDDATYNVTLNGIGNIRFICDDVIDFMERSKKENQQEMRRPSNTIISPNSSLFSYPTTVIIDPPRSGCDSEFLDSLCSVYPDTVIYVSCNVHTLCRDLKRFLEANYRIDIIQPIDMFPHTLHTELLVILQLDK